MKLKLLILATLILVSCETEFESEFCPSLQNCSPIVFTTVFIDKFNRTDETPIASPWTRIQGSVGGDMELLSFVLTPKRGSGDSPSAIYNSAVTTRAVRVSVTAKITGTNFGDNTPGEVILWARTQASSSVDNGYFCGINPGNGVVTIGKSVSGAASSLGASGGTFTLDDKDSFYMVFTLIDSSFTCSITKNNTTTYTATGSDSSYVTGFAGVKGGKTTFDELSFDNFTLESGE